MINNEFMKKLTNDIVRLEKLRYLVHPEISPIHRDQFAYYSTIIDLRYIMLREKDNPNILLRDIPLIQELDLLRDDKRECIYDLLLTLIESLEGTRSVKSTKRKITLSDIVKFCLDTNQYAEFSDLELMEIYPGYYKARLMICKNDNGVYELFNTHVYIDYLETTAYASISNITEEGNCTHIEIDIANVIEHDWNLKVSLRLDTPWSSFSNTYREIWRTYTIHLRASQGGSGEYIKLWKTYNYINEAIIYASNGAGRYFPDIKGNNINLPTFWLCRELHENYTIKQSICKTTGSSLTALVFEPVIGKDKIKNQVQDPERFLKSYPKKPYLYRPLGYSGMERALFFEVPAYGTLDVYKKRILDLPPRDLYIIIKSMIDSVEAYRKELGKHGLITDWNIFLTSRGVKLGPSRTIANELFRVPLKTELNDYQMLARVVSTIAEDLLESYNNTNSDTSVYINEITGALEEGDIQRVYNILSDWKAKIS